MTTVLNDAKFELENIRTSMMAAVSGKDVSRQQVGRWLERLQGVIIKLETAAGDGPPLDMAANDIQFCDCGDVAANSVGECVTCAGVVYDGDYANTYATGHA